MALIPGTRFGVYEITAAGGNTPRWSATTRELLFIGLQGRITAAPYAVVGDAFRADTPQIWSPAGIQGAGDSQPAFDLHPDGTRVAAAAATEQGDKAVFVFNFGDYLRTIAPGAK